MIQVSRSLLRQFRTALRRSAWQHARRSGPQPAVVFDAGAGGLTIRAFNDGIALAHHTPGGQPIDMLSLPGGALDELEGRGDAVVTLEATAADAVLARWDDGGVPREKEHAVAKTSQRDFPKLPDRFTTHDLGLIQALHDAMQTTQQRLTQFATDNIQLRGPTGEIAATDGRQLLLQSGYQFCWTDDVLVPRVTVFGWPDLAGEQDVRIGKTDSHVCVQIGPWSVWLPIDINGRYPKVENIIPKVSAAKTHVHLASDDAAFLANTLPRLPGNDEELPFVTLDLNGPVTVRARAAGQNHSTDVVLVGSNATGQPIRYAVKRAHLARILELGFSELHIGEANTPAVCQDERRKYVFLSLGDKTAVAPGPNDITLRSGAAATVNPPPIPQGETPVRPTPSSRLPAPLANGNGQQFPNGAGQHQPGDGQNNGNGQRQPSDNGQPTDSNGPHAEKSGFQALLEEAQSLQNILRDALNRTNQLIGGLKQYRRHAKTMQSTLTALRHLEPVEA